MGKVVARALSVAELPAAAALLAQSFLDDQGMIVLFTAREEQDLKKSMLHWFNATLRMWHQKKQLMLGAFDEGELVGALLVGRTDLRVTGVAQLLWMINVGWHCGFATIMRTAKHDAHRQHSFPQSFAYIVEFVAVDGCARGKGVGRTLFEQFHSRLGEAEQVWLETTRQENLSIFSKLGYQECARSTSLGANFVQMLRIPTKEKPIASS